MLASDKMAHLVSQSFDDATAVASTDFSETYRCNYLHTCMYRLQDEQISLIDLLTCSMHHSFKGIKAMKIIKGPNRQNIYCFKISQHNSYK